MLEPLNSIFCDYDVSLPDNDGNTAIRRMSRIALMSINVDACERANERNSRCAQVLLILCTKG